MMLILAYIVAVLAILGALYVHVAGWDKLHDETAEDEAWIAGRQKVRRHQL